MKCKHCPENVEPNKVKRSQAPFVYHPWKHEGTHFIGCTDKSGNPLGSKAEPEENNG